jgi:hypothetical protein
VADSDGFDGDNDRPLVLGGELASAIRAEQSHVQPEPSPIADVDYPEGADDLWRWVDCPQDEMLSAFVGSHAAADGPARARIRASLTMDDLYTVLLFARRRAFAAIRTGAPRAVVDAFDAVSAIDIERVDWRDVVVAAVLAAYSASHAAIAAGTAAAGAIGRADSPVAEIMAEAVDQDEIDLAEECGYRVVTTADGPVLFEDEGEPYAPDRDLVPIAVGIAAAVERDRTYRVAELGVGNDLPAIWVGADSNQRVAAAIENLTGCASIDAEPVAGGTVDLGGHFLALFVAEAATAQDAAAIAESANRSTLSGSVVIGVAAERLCVVGVAASTGTGEPSFENADTMARFRPMITALLD